MPKTLYDGLISAKQRNNLIKLRNNLIDLFPTHKDIFDMACFVSFKGGDLTYREETEKAVQATPKNPCMSSCCIIGYGPSCGIPVIDEDRNGSKTIWDQYSYRVFVDASDENQRKSDMWDFLFSCYWDTKDREKIGLENTDMKEAIARLTLFITGKCPDEFTWDYTDTYFQQFENMPLNEIKKLV